MFRDITNEELVGLTSAILDNPHLTPASAVAALRTLFRKPPPPRPLEHLELSREEVEYLLGATHSALIQLRRERRLHEQDGWLFSSEYVNQLVRDTHSYISLSRKLTDFLAGSKP